MENETTALRQIELFSGLEIEQVQMIAFASSHKIIPQGHLIFRQGDIGGCAYLVLRGRVSVLSVLPSGEEIERGYPENSLLGENAILADSPYISTARAITEVDALVIPRDVFMRMLNSSPSAAMKIMQIVQKRLDSTLGDLNQYKPNLIHNKTS